MDSMNEQTKTAIENAITTLKKLQYRFNGGIMKVPDEIEVVKTIQQLEELLKCES